MAFPRLALEKNTYPSRRNFLKLGLMAGAIALIGVPQVLMAQTSISIKKLTFNADDIGILNFALLLEELESAFDRAVISSGKIANTRELDYLRALGNHEATHVKFLRNILGQNTLFQSSELSLNQQGLDTILTDRSKILNTAVTLEDLGVHAYNGAGLSLTNPTYLLAAGSIVSVEARHAVGVRSLLERPTTETDNERSIENDRLQASLNPFRGRAYDELFTPKQVVAAVGALNTYSLSPNLYVSYRSSCSAV